MDKLWETSLKTSSSFLLSERPPVPHIHVPSSLCLMIIMSEAKRGNRIVKWITVYRILLQNTNHSQHLVYFLGLPNQLKTKSSVLSLGKELEGTTKLRYKLYNWKIITSSFSSILK